MKNKFLYPFVELIGQAWDFTPQKNLDRPSWKTNFYTPSWDWKVKGDSVFLKQISIDLYEKPISISLSGNDSVKGEALPLKQILIGLHEKPISILLHENWWVTGDASPLKRISMALHEKMDFLLFVFFFEWKKKRLTTSFFLLWCVITTILLPLWKKKFYKQISIELIIAEAQTILDIP